MRTGRRMYRSRRNTIKTTRFLNYMKKKEMPSYEHENLHMITIKLIGKNHRNKKINRPNHRETNTIKEKETSQRRNKFIFDILEKGDKIITGTVNQILYDHLGPLPNSVNIGNISIIAEKVGLAYSKKKRLLLWLGFNGSNCSILFFTKKGIFEDLYNMYIVGINNIFNINQSVIMQSNKNYEIENISDVISKYSTVINLQKDGERIKSKDLF